MACATMQNLCTMMAGGMLSCGMMMNGMMVNCCNMTMGMTRCEMTEKGCTFTCTSGDKACCEHDPGLLRLHGRHDEGGLHLLRHDERHVLLLRLLLKSARSANDDGPGACPGPFRVSPFRDAIQSWLLSSECSPHSVLAWPAQRPARSSCPWATALVQGQQPMEG